MRAREGYWITQVLADNLDGARGLQQPHGDASSERRVRAAY
jgi:hypothetical protein